MEAGSVITTVLALALSAQASAAEPAITETWEWDSKSPTCALKQHVPAGAEEVTIERTPGGEETELLVTLQAGPKLGHGHFLDASIGVDSGRAFLADIYFAVDSDGRSKLYIDSPDPAFIDNLSGTTGLNISYGENKRVRVQIHVPAKLIATLRECEDTTMRGWGIDPLAWRGLQSRPLPAEHVRERFHALDYPADALAANVEADAVVWLDVAPDSSVTNCSIVNAGVPKSFGVASCNVLKGAKFKPATDASGKPVSAPIVYDVRFRIGS
jgi:hypothetical protein